MARSESRYHITRLNRLAFPRGKKPTCELSGLPATVACITPDITLYYATEEQAEQAWYGTASISYIKCEDTSFVLKSPSDGFAW